jgi:hypothetical protein
VAEFEITVRATSEDGSYSLRTFSIALNRVVDPLPGPEEAYLDEIIFDLVPTETAPFDQPTQSGSDAEPLPAQTAGDATAESEQSSDTPETVLQTELEEPAGNIKERFSSALFSTEDRNSRYVKTRLTPTPVPPNELPQFNTLSVELFEVPETFWNLLDAMNQEMSAHRNVDVASVGLGLQSVTFGTFALSAGYVVWLLRAGVLSASLLSSAPLWRQIDPLPVLSARAQRRDTDQEEASDDDPRENRLSKLFEQYKKNKHNRSTAQGMES